MNSSDKSNCLVVKHISSEKGNGVFSTSFIKKGEIVIVGHRIEDYPERTDYSVQLDWDRHIKLNEPAIFINHSCDPNTAVKNNAHDAYDFIALKDIPIDEEITFDYETTEYYCIGIHTCYCHSKNCRKELKGFCYLPSFVKEKFGENIANYLKKF